MTNTTTTAPPALFPNLNPRQREAATHSRTPLLIRAGAGTGKTNTLAHRVAYLALRGTLPERILLLTFTNAAAQEMTSRATRIVSDVLRKHGKPGQKIEFPFAGTFHAIGRRLIINYGNRIGSRSMRSGLRDLLLHSKHAW